MATFAAALMALSDSVIRSGGGLGELVMGSTQSGESLASGVFGKMDATCPSGPTPEKGRHECRGARCL